MRRSLIFRWLMLVWLPVVLLVTAAGTAVARPGLGGPVTGDFLRAGVPVYAAAPDGWRCHYMQGNRVIVGDGCVTPTQRATRQPGPAWSSRTAYEPIDDVVCRRGHFILIEQHGRRGWAPKDGVGADYTNTLGSIPGGCDAFQWS